MGTFVRVRRLSGQLRRFVRVLARDVRSIPNVGPTLLLGGLLWAYAVWLVVPSFLVMGFFVRVLRHVPSSVAEMDLTPRPAAPPRFDRWAALLWDGVRAYVIWTAYIFIAFAGYLSVFETESSSTILLAIVNSLLGNVSFLLTLHAALDGGATEPDALSVGVLVDPALLGLLVAMYLGPAALLNFAARGTLSDGFSFADLRPILRSPTYARNWTVFVLAWLVGTLVLLAPSTRMAAFFVPVDVPILVEAVRESIELFRGFVSFAVFLLGYVALGRVPVPPRDELSLGAYLQSQLNSGVVAFAGRVLRSGQTILIAALLASFWSLPSIVLLMGYVTRLVRRPVDAPFPSFSSLDALAVDGLRAVGLWFVYGFPPLVFLFVWNSSNLWPHAVVGNVLTGLPAFVVGAWYLGRDIYRTMIYAWPNGLSAAPIDPMSALVAFVVLSLLGSYLYPAAVILVGRSRDVRSGLSPRGLARAVGTLAYAAAWLRAMVSLALGAGFLLAWNYWRSRPERRLLEDTTRLFPLGDFSLITVPTEVGILSSLLLFLAATGTVLLLFQAYSELAKAIPDSRPEGTPEP